MIRSRARLRKIIRDFFERENFLEVDTPILVPYENPDENVKNLKVEFSDFTLKKHLWFLHTSPEFFMKRLLFNESKIFQIVKAFRDEEITPRHSVEFTIVEWYRVGGDYFDGIKETESLVCEAFEGFGVKLRSPFLKLSVDEVFKESVGVSAFDKEAVIELADEDSYEASFNKLLVSKVEPFLSMLSSPVFIYDYPAELSATAKVRGNVAQRFELYIGELEVANGYTERTTYSEYIEKFVLKERAIDIGFLELLKQKSLPPCEGVALGFDRLLMAILSKSDISEVLPFSTQSLLKEVSRWRN